MAAVTAEEREKFLQLMQEYNKSLENTGEVEVISAEQMDDTITMPGVKGSIDPTTGVFKPEKYVQAPMSAFAKPAKDAAQLVQERIDAFNDAVSRAEDVLVNMQSATDDARNIVNTAKQAADDVRETLDALRSVEVNARQLAEDVETANDLLDRLAKAIADANSATQSATTQAQYAMTQGDYAKAQGDRVSQAILDVATEKQAAIDAAANANTAAGNANSIYSTVKTWYESVKPAWDKWFTDTKKAWTDWFDSIKSAYSTWFTNADNAEKARATAESGRGTAENARVTAENSRVTAEKGRVSAESSRVTAEQKRVDEMNELHEHPDMMGDNGNWWRWNLQTHQYVDTGVLAKGGILYPTFEIDLDDGGLYMYGAGEATKDSFEFNEQDGGLYYLPRTKES